MSTIGNETADRQRQRAERGVGTTRKAGGRLPSNVKRRRPAVAALGVLLIVGGALIAGLLAIRVDEREAVLQIARDVPVGKLITREDLAETRVAGDSLNLIPVADAGRIMNHTYAKTNLVKGQLLDQKQVTPTAPIDDSKAAVGIELVAGRVPAGGLREGDLVQLVKIGLQNTAPVVLGTGTVIEASKQASAGTALGDKSTSNAPTATVLVNRGLVAAITDASGNKRIAVGLLQRGVSVEPK